MDLLVASNVALAVFTGVYVYLTHRLLQESCIARREMQRARVVADIEAEGSMFYLVVRNLGYGPALDLELRIDPEITRYDGRVVSSLAIAALGVNQVRKYPIDVSHKFFDGSKCLQYTLTLTYRDPVVGRVSTSYRLDLESFRQTIVEPPPLRRSAKRLADTLEKIESHLRRVADKLRIVLDGKGIGEVLAKGLEGTGDDRGHSPPTAEEPLSRS